MDDLRNRIMEVFYDNTTFAEKADRILALVAEDRVALMRRAEEAEHDSDTFEAAFKQAEAREAEALRDVQQLHDAAVETEDKLDDLKRKLAAAESDLQDFKCDCDAIHLSDHDEVVALTVERDDLRCQLEETVSEKKVAWDRMAVHNKDADDAVARAEAREAVLVKALEEYGSHQISCPLAQWSQGRPTKDGGYETMYAGKWYQGDDKPACTCGLDAALAGRKP